MNIVPPGINVHISKMLKRFQTEKEQEIQRLQDIDRLENDFSVMGLRLLLYRKNMWLRMMYCLQIIWQENRKLKQRLWSATILCREDMVEAGCE